MASAMFEYWRIQKNADVVQFKVHHIDVQSNLTSKSNA